MAQKENKKINDQTDRDFFERMESLDEKSKMLAKAYISALMDRQMIGWIEGR